VRVTYRAFGYATDSLTVTLQVAPPPPPVLLQVHATALAGCGPATLQAVSGLPPGTHLYWQGPGVTVADTLPSLTVRQPGQWHLLARRGQCLSIDSVTVVRGPVLPDSVLASSGSGCVGGSVTSVVLNAVDDLPAGTHLRWLGPGTTAADTLTALTVALPGTYTLLATLDQCRAEQTYALPGCDGPMPNVITPNGDGLNEVLVVPQPGSWTLEVYDRWGRPVWRSAPGGYRDDWGGQGSGDGTYFYLLTHLLDGRRLKGWVTLMR
jgi:hypothetical protein